jgi:hypothetical protein
LQSAFIDFLRTDCVRVEFSGEIIWRNTMTFAASEPTRNGREDHPFLAEQEARTIAISSVSWGAVLAGLMVALVTQLILNLIGIGIGAASFDPAAGTSPSASGFSIAAGVWWALSGIIASLAGGYTAGRMSGHTTDTAGAWHGLTAWAVTTLVVFYLLSTSIGAIVGGAFRTLGSVASGAGQAVGATAQSAAQVAAPALSKSADPFSSIEQSIRDASGGNDPAALREAAAPAMRALVTGDAAKAEEARERATQALAKAQNISAEQARTQVTQYEQQYRQTVDQAKQKAVAAADATATAVTRGALFGAIALLFGALAGWIGGRMGTTDPAHVYAFLRRARRIG